MIWSVMPEELLWGGEASAPPLEAIVEYQGRRLCVRGGCIAALLSTDPADFLDQRFAPGALVNINRP